MKVDFDSLLRARTYKEDKEFGCTKCNKTFFMLVWIPLLMFVLIKNIFTFMIISITT